MIINKTEKEISTIINEEIWAIEEGISDGFEWYDGQQAINECIDKILKRLLDDENN